MKRALWVCLLPNTGKVGMALPFVELARKAKCSRCGRRGCHVQPADPPKPEHRDYALWLLAEIDRRKEFIRWAEQRQQEEQGTQMADHTNAPGPDLSDRICPVCGGRNAYFGFGPPGSEAGVRWYCGRQGSWE